MSLEKSSRLVLLGILCILLSACVSSSGGSNNTLSKQEKAALNLRMGVRYLDMGMLDVAKEKLEKAYRLDSKSSEVHNALAVLYERIRQPETARYHYREAMDLSPDDYSIKNNYGRFLCDTGDYGEAMPLLNQAAQMPLNNRKWLALTNIGLCYLKQNQKDQAERAFRQALQEQPDYAPALLEMQQLSYNKRKYMSARAFLERYLAVAQHTPQTLWIAIQTERALGDPLLTEKYINLLLSQFPETEQARQIKTAVNR